MKWQTSGHRKQQLLSPYSPYYIRHTVWSSITTFHFAIKVGEEVNTSGVRYEYVHILTLCYIAHHIIRGPTYCKLSPFSKCLFASCALDKWKCNTVGFFFLPSLQHVLIALKVCAIYHCGAGSEKFCIIVLHNFIAIFQCFLCYAFVVKFLTQLCKHKLHILQFK